MKIRTLFVLSFLVLALSACGGDSDDTSGNGTSAGGGGSDVAAPKGAVLAADKHIAEEKVDTTQPGWKTKLTMPPQFEFDAGDTYYWVLVTNQGTMKFKLLPDVAPMHVSSTIYLTRLGFYDDVEFHRVIKDFMAQGGDPLGVGRGGPGYKYSGEFSPSVRHDKPGLLSMANSGPGTDGSQFFITFKPTPWLDDKHTVFGEIVEGEDIVEHLNSLAKPPQTRDTAPTEPIFIEKATIEVE